MDRELHKEAGDTVVKNFGYLEEGQDHLDSFRYWEFIRLKIAGKTKDSDPVKFDDVKYMEAFRHVVPILMDLPNRKKSVFNQQFTQYFNHIMIGYLMRYEGLLSRKDKSEILTTVSVLADAHQNNADYQQIAKSVHEAIPGSIERIVRTIHRWRKKK